MKDTTPSSHPCGNCAFYAQSVWEPVVGGDVAVLARRFTRRELGAGQVLWEQKSPETGVVCVSRGLIALRRLHADGSSTLLRLAYPGEIVGIRAFLTGRAHRTEAKALLPSRVCVVPSGKADRIVKTNPDVLSRLAIRCIDEMDRNHDRIVATARMSNKAHLASLLYRLMDAHGETRGDRRKMRLPLSRSELAELIGVQPETLSRLLRRLKGEGRIAVNGREVEMPLPSGNGAEHRTLRA